MDVMKELNNLTIRKPLAELKNKNYDYCALIAECSIVNGEQALTEDQVRAMVGAPSREEEETCICGEPIETCPDAYSHMSHGV